MIRAYRSLFAVPGAARFSTAAFIGRLPVPMLGLGVILLVSERSGSYRTAGLVAAATMLGYALGAPAAGRLVDRFGQRRVLLASSAVHAAGLLALLFAANAQAWVLCLAGAVTGASRPSTGTMVRTRWAHVLTSPAATAPRPATASSPSNAAKASAAPLETAFSFEAVLDEVAFIAGPVVVTALATHLSPQAGLLCCLLLTVGGSTALALQHASEPPLQRRHAHRGTALLARGMPAIVAVACCGGLVVGLLDLAVVARTESLGSRALSGPLLAVLALGSMAGGLWYGSRVWQAAPHVLWIRCLGVQVLGLIPLALSTGVPTLTVAMFVAGLTVTPIGISGLVLLERLLPQRLLTEGMGAETAAMALGAAGGGWLSGVMVEALGTARTLALPAAAAALAFLIAACCLRSTVVSAEDRAQRPVPSGAEPGAGQQV